MEFIRAVLLGTGDSSSTPRLACVVSGNPCQTCQDALSSTQSRNHRLNPSLLIQLRHPIDGSIHNVIVDCGKTFREAALKCFPRHNVRDISAVLVTHGHADAVFGFDDLREFNRLDDEKGMDIYVDSQTMQFVQQAFGYLFPIQSSRSRTWVAQMNWFMMAPMQVLEVEIRSRTEAGASLPAGGCEQWPVVPIPVLHGPNYYSNCFLFRIDGGATGELVSLAPRYFLYASDVSEMGADFLSNLEVAKGLLLSQGDRAQWGNNILPLDTLVLDMLSTNKYISHLCVEEALSLATKLMAERTVFIGMSHTLEYDQLMTMLHKRGVDGRMTIGFDGLIVAGDASPPRQ